MEKPIKEIKKKIFDIKNRAYCPYCKAERELVRPKFSGWTYFLVSIFTAGWGLILYPIYHWGGKNRTQCHVCNGKIAKWINRDPLFEKE